ncbi:hypothetical protein ACB092_09G036300 [Castanea dentata]
MMFLPLSSRLSLHLPFETAHSPNYMDLPFPLQTQSRSSSQAALSPNRMDLPFSLQTQSRSSYSFADLVRKECIRLDAQNFKMEGTNEERKVHVG